MTEIKANWQKHPLVIVSPIWRGCFLIETFQLKISLPYNNTTEFSYENLILC